MGNEEGPESLKMLVLTDVNQDERHQETDPGGFKEVSGYECWRLGKGWSPGFSGYLSTEL